jgi:hypothetical protein
MARPDKGGRQLRVSAEALDVGRDEEAPKLAAYAFGRSGRLLDRTELEPGQDAVLTLPEAAEPDEIRVLVGPVLQDDGPRLLANLVRIGAAEKLVRPADEVERIELPIDRGLWHCWLSFCTVRGTLVKRVTTGGIHLELPVCNAEVEVYEVDPLPILIARIPDHILERLREVVRRPIPDPDPGPFLPIGHDPVPAPVAALFATTFAAPGTEAGELVQEQREEDGPRLFRFAGAEQQPVSREEVADALRAVTADPTLVRAAKIDTAAFRDALLAQPLLSRPLLCFLWPAAVTTQLVATAVTDDCGHFRAVFYRGCSSDVPDLYFKAYRRFGFWRIPIYAPTPIACHTWWNYACGSEVRLATTSPFAQACPPCPPVIAPDHWVLAMAVGNTSLASIRGTSAALAATTDAGNFGLTADGAPWGGYLHLRFEFDHNLRTDLNVRYYQVSWRKVGSGNPYVPLTDTQLRHYLHQVGSDFPIDPYVLGPQTVNGTPNLFEIPPALPPVGQWVIADAVVDTSSAGFASASLAPPAGAGFYDFRLDLFDGNGVRVDATALGISYRVPATTDLTATIHTDDAASLGLVTAGGSLVYRLHIDNNPCTGSIGAAELGGDTAGSECGVLDYGSTAATLSLPFTASHPNGFADYSFNVFKGLVSVVGSGGPVGPPPGEHTLTPSAAELLGACTTAGFAEDLHVRARATNGWSRQLQYDSHPSPRPFVLTPQA